MGEWHVYEYFSYIRIWGSNTIHIPPNIVLNKLVIEEVSFQTVTDGVYKRLVGPKRKGSPKLPLDLGPLVIPNSTWAVVLGDQINYLKLGFDFKRKHDPKGFLDAHLKQNHIRNGYAHEYVPDDSIYQGVNTFSKVLARAKSKDEQSQILQYQRELKTKVLVYRKMELDILEKVIKHREAQEAKFP